MARIVMTYEIAHACAMDAATARMRREGRKSWNEEDQHLACQTFNELWTEEMEINESLRIWQCEKRSGKP